MTRKLFGTDGIRGIANQYPMTADVAIKLGKAIAITFRNGKPMPRIVIGKDTRESGYLFEYALTAGIVAMGGRALLVGPMPTPTIARLTKSMNADAGIMITASHNPYQDNGIKIFNKNGFKLSDEVEQKIEKLVIENNFEIYQGQVGNTFRVEQVYGRYVEFAKATINDNSLEGLKIVVDCANGAAYKIASYVFKELGAESIILNNQPDGKNINEKCGSLHPEIIKAAVLGHKADIGIALDGDADRVIVIDENGQEVDGDKIMLICANQLKKQGKLNKDTIVTTVMSNIGMQEAADKLNIKLVRTKVGDRYVIKEMKDNNYNFGGEQSGHIIFLEHTTTGDGIITALQLLNIIKQTGTKLSQLANIMTTYPQTLVNINVISKPPLESLELVQKIIKQVESTLGQQGRVLVRYSGTENLCRVMIEGKDQQQITQLANQIAEEIKKVIG